MNHSYIRDMLIADFTKHISNQVINQTSVGGSDDFYIFFLRIQDNLEEVGLVAIDIRALMQSPNPVDLVNQFMAKTKLMRMLSSYKGIFSYIKICPSKDHDLIGLVAPHCYHGLQVVDFNYSSTTDFSELVPSFGKHTLTAGLSSSEVTDFKSSLAENISHFTIGLLRKIGVTPP